MAMTVNVSKSKDRYWQDIKWERSGFLFCFINVVVLITVL